MKQARAYSSALDQRDEQERLAQQARMRNQTIQSMQTKKYELDERKLGVSQPKTQYVSALPILDTVDSVVNPALKQNTTVVQGLRKTVQQYAPAPTLANASGRNNYLSQSNPVVNSFQTAMPNASLVQQATNNFQQWNKQYEQDEDRYIDDLDRVTTLIGLGAPNEDADKQLAESEEKLNQTKAQWNSMMRQTLDMLGPAVEDILKTEIEDAINHPGPGYKVQYTQEETERREQNKKREQELRKLLGNDLYGELAEYVRQQENSIRMSKKKEEAAKFANENGVGASAVSIPKKLIGGISGVFDAYAQTIDRIVSGSHAPLDWNTEFQVPNREASTIRSTVAQNIAEDTGSTKVLPGLYNFGMGMADAVAAMPINAITGGWGTALMASAAANDTMQNIKARGGSDDQALTLGTVTLIAEILTEKMSFDDLDALDVSDMTNFKETLWNNVKSQGKSEGMEEGIAESIEAIADVVIMGDKSELRQSMQEYEARGYNRDQALAMAIGGAAGNIMLSSAGGTVSGGLFAAGKTTGAWALDKIGGYSQNANADANENSPFQVQVPQDVQQNVQQNVQQDVQQNPFEVRQTKQNAPAADITQETQSQAEMKGNRQGPIEPSAYRQTAQQILNENIFGSKIYGTAMEETGLTRGEVRQALRDIARGNQSKVADANVQTVLRAIQTVAVNAPAVETSQGQEPIRVQEQQVGPKNSTEEELNRAQLAALEELKAKKEETQPGQSVGGQQDQLNGPILAAMNELIGQKAEQTADGVGAKTSDFAHKVAPSQTHGLEGLEAKIGTPKEQQTPIEHEVITNAETKNNARLRLEQDYEGEKTQLLETNRWNSEEAAMSDVILSDLKAEAEKNSASGNEPVELRRGRYERCYSV